MPILLRLGWTQVQYVNSDHGEAVRYQYRLRMSTQIQLIGQFKTHNLKTKLHHIMTLYMQTCRIETVRHPKIPNPSHQGTAQYGHFAPR